MFLPKISLLPEELLVQTSTVDHADWNYRPVLGKIQRVRFQLIKTLLGRLSGEYVLEIGYGSGVFFPELTGSFANICGIDPHQKQELVAQSLSRAGIDAELRSGSAEQMPFMNDQFDVVVAVSSLEYVDDIDAACREILRVMQPDGRLILVTPGKSPLLDAGLKILGNEDADDNYGDRRERLLAALTTHFDVEQRRVWPWPGIPWLTAYRALRLKPRSDSNFV